LNDLDFFDFEGLLNRIINFMLIFSYIYSLLPSLMIVLDKSQWE
jgi:hypothetical protein